MSVRMNFEHELETLRENMDAMGKGIQQAFADLLSAIALNDLEELDRIQKNDRKINEMERKIESRMPAASDQAASRCWQVICVSYLLL
ncbi:MAG: PhoU domain-containing protein [Lachnospiraceae bacterium]